MWDPRDVNEKEINQGSKITEDSTANKDLFNAIVELLLYLKEV